MINLFLIDDHPLMINGIVAAFDDKIDKIKISGTALSANEALKKLKKSTAQVILLDLLMPEISGVELSIILKRDFPDKKIIAFTGETDTALLYNAWMNGVDAILIKHCGKQEIIDTINNVLEGNRIIGSNVPSFFAEIGVTRDGKKIHLTKKEQQVLSTLALVIDRKKAAEQLGISKNAIDFHCKNIFKKFNKNKLVAVIEEAKKAKILC